ncbi:hypothetical protein FOL47_007370 [Perkinsus chesapeaki]|uniref:Uncharacterized protein n=1 Tax=Perkinsus chesapeaki TaxID=330153 RepID=A0A7J6LL26_PERCH|nr:hypothetical protein FOL47_007370 [Perkinsus chesapeaki]
MVSDNPDASRGNKIISLDDNANLCKTCKYVQGDFGYTAEPYAGLWTKHWKLLEPYVDRCLWVPREVDALKWVDLSGRKLAKQEADNGVEVLVAEVPQTKLDVDPHIEKEVNEIMHHYTIPNDKSMSLLVSFSGTDLPGGAGMVTCSAKE